MLPVYYRKLAGNITDVKIIENLVKDVDFLKLEKLKFVMDIGFYSEKNINDLMKHHHKFLIGARLSLNLVNGTPDPEDTKLYQKFFTIHETPVRGKVYSFYEDAIRKAECNYGYFALRTNGIKDPVEALRIYRLKNLIE